LTRGKCDIFEGTSRGGGGGTKGNSLWWEKGAFVKKRKLIPPDQWGSIVKKVIKGLGQRGRGYPMKERRKTSGVLRQFRWKFESVENSRKGKKRWGKEGILKVMCFGLKMKEEGGGGKQGTRKISRAKKN